MSVERTTKDGLKLITVKTQPGDVVSFTTHGAHVISWKPHTETHDVLYLSEKAVYRSDKAIRGGIPVCWPWFGPVHNPQHGYARISEWNEDSIEFTDNKTKAHIVLSLLVDKEVDNQKFHLKAIMDITFGNNTFTQSLKTINLSKDSNTEITDALHTYYSIEDITKIAINGLENTTFYDKVHIDKSNPDKITPAEGAPLRFNGAYDRDYYPTNGEVIIHDEARERAIKIDRSGSNSVVVWNVHEGAKSLSDMGDDDYKKYVCVEASNIRGDTITLKPGQEHVLSFTVTILKE
ncbi:hypothetical protein M9Y10_005908 [Tritrichomonas musculus]|uniref:glucose-6-phosphate 1-epimerase n=1 Tax=Tritrichomonas musculus TaxID=1915356 RepID=A0ABR2JDX8_9EUKA